MAVTYEPIASTTTTSSATTITFSNIPGTYTDLILVGVGRAASGSNSVSMRVNGDSGSNYSYTAVYGDGSSAASVRSSNATKLYFASVGTGQTVNIAHFMSYANTNVFKTVLVSSNRPEDTVQRFVELWRSTSAITSVQVFADTSNYTDGFTFSLFGVKAQ